VFNMVTPFNLNPAKKIPKNFILYPVRAIRRKNIGEAFLLSLFFPENHALIITLPPNSDRDFHYYALWKQFAKDMHLNIIFEASEKYNFTDLVQSAKRIITTSISEGFGFSYLEPWTAGQMLSGRRLTGICSDFTGKHMELEHLYDKILIPISSIDHHLFFHQWKACILENARLLKISVSESAINKVFKRITSDSTIDFGMLDEHFQIQVIKDIESDINFKIRLMDLNPFLSDLSQTHNNSQIIRHNRSIVEKEFSQKAYKNLLIKTYQKIICQPVSHHIDKKILAENFLNLDKFSLLKWSHADV